MRKKECIGPDSTKRVMIDVGRKCNVGCKFCYYHYLGDLSKQGWSNVNNLKIRIDQSYQIGDNYIDFTGGEPTIYPFITELIQYGLEKNMKSCIITNGQINELQIEKILNAGIDDFLVSVHGLNSTHDYLVGKPGAYKQLEKFLAIVSKRTSFRFNLVLNKYNQDELFEIAEWMSKWNPSIVNFINMNVHYEWKNNLESVFNVIADLKKVEIQLNKVIPFLEGKNIGVNIRYYPMCRIAEEYRRCICNVLHVAFDPYEWDYPRHPKTLIRYTQWGLNLTEDRENKEEPCNQCDLQWICGGVNKWFHKANKEEICTAIKNSGIENRNDFYYYRKYNVKTLIRK